MAEGIVARVIEQEGRSPGLEIEIHAARTPELIRLARVAWAVSGSVGLELMVEALPSVVLYKIKRFDLWVARFFIKSRYISLVNLLADTELFPGIPDLARRVGRTRALGTLVARRSDSSR